MNSNTQAFMQLMKTRPRAAEMSGADIRIAAHTYLTATKLVPLITRDFGDTPGLQEGRRAVLARDSGPTRRNR